MESRRLGGSDLDVSRVGLGCNNFGWRLDRAATVTVVEAALEAGITFFDTADVYGSGDSERFLGEALGDRRGDAVVDEVRPGRRHSRPGGSRDTCVWRSRRRSSGSAPTSSISTTTIARTA